MSRNPVGLPPVSERFAWLLKHARERLSGLMAEKLAALNVSGRELAVLTAIAEREPVSQFEAARRLAVDRTTMVGLIDALVTKGLLEREVDQADRRRNVIRLTAPGHRTLAEGTRATDAAEDEFLAPLSDAEAAQLRTFLQRLVEHEASRQR